MSKQFILRLAIILVILVLLPEVITAQESDPLPLELKARQWRSELLSEPIGAQFSDTDPESAEVHTTSAVAEGADYIAWSRMVFQSFREGNWEIYLADADAGNPKHLTSHQEPDLDPRLNQGSTRVAFASRRHQHFDIFSINTDGSNLTRLTSLPHDERTPSWSPDGSRIAFTVLYPSGNWDIYVMNADGSDQTRLTDSLMPDVSPTWSPDGQRIAWVHINGLNGILRIMNADGSNAQSLTDPLQFLGNPVWSPDGERIAFDYDADGDIWTELAVINVATKHLSTKYDLRTNWADAWMGSWSPDGDWLIYSRVEYGIQDNQLVITRAFIEQKSLTSGSWWRLTTLGVDMLPDCQTADITPPAVSMSHLPPLSHSKDFAVSWSGNDIGPAGIQSYEVQFRDGVGGNWTPWLQNTQEVSAPFGGVPGHTYGFRARAVDRAGNTASWQGNQSDVETTLYTWQVSGIVRDARDIPMPDVPLQSAPKPLFPSVISDSSGRFLAYMLAEGQHVLTAERTGYGTASPMILDLNTDRVVQHVLPPPDNRLYNGGFEVAPLAGSWQTSGDPAPVLSESVHHTGRKSVALSS